MSTVARGARSGLSPRDEDRLAVGLLSVGAAMLHLSAAQGHWSESWFYGVAFLAMGVGQGLWTVLVLRRGDVRLALVSGVVLTAAVLGVYLASRTVGLPVGPDVAGPEPVGIADLCATLDEVALLWGSLRLLRGRRLGEAGLGVGLGLAFVSLIVFSSIAHIA